MRNHDRPARVLAVCSAVFLCGAGQVSTPARTSLPMTLVGVMADSADPARSACLVKCTQLTGRKSASMLQVGDTACDLAQVAEIRPDAVVVRNLSADRLELLPLEDAGGAARPRQDAADAEPAPIVVNEERGVVSVDVPKAAVERYLVNLSELLTSAQATPRVRAASGGRQVIDGFELRQVKAGSVIEKIGLKDGDVILEVNGEPLDGLPTVLRLYGQAQAAGQARLTVLRGSQRMTFQITTR